MTVRPAPDGDWALYPDAALRMTGFLSLPQWEFLLPAGLLAALDTADETFRAAQRYRSELLTTVFPAAVEQTGDRAARRTLSKLRTVVGKSRPAAADTAPQELKDAVLEWNGLLAEADRAVAALRETYAEDLPVLRRRLHKLFSDTALQEAVAQLSPSVAASLLRWADGPLPENPASRERGLEHRLTLYLQRLVAKNETNNYFGPVGSATISTREPEPLRIAGRPGCKPPFVFSSPRVAQGIAERIVADLGAGPHLALRRSPMFALEGDRLTHLASGRSTPLSAAEQAVWRSAGERGPYGPEEAADRLVRLGALSWHVPIDLWSPEPLESLETWLRQRPRSPAADAWLRRLGELRGQLRAFTNTAPGSARRAVLDRLEERCAELTGGQGSRQGSGRMYADRSVLFEERENRLSLVIGGGAAAGLAGELTPVLDYWAATACQRWRQHQRVAAELYDRTWPDRREVPLPAFLAAAARLDPVAEPTDAEVQAAGLVGGSTDEVRLFPEQLEPFADAIEGPVFSSVDVMVADVEKAAATSRRWCWVLGEAHAGHLLSVFPTDHFARLRDPYAHAQRDTWLYEAMQRTGRRAAWLVTGRETKIFQYRQPAVAVQLRPHLPEHAAVSAGQLTVRRGADGVTLYDAEGPLWLLPAVRPATTAFDPLAPLSFPAVQNEPLGRGPLRPRVIVGRTVVQRASWRLPAPPLARLRGVEQLLAARAFRREHGMSDLVFVRPPWEQKPVLLDFRNPLSVGAFAGLLRHDPDGAGEEGGTELTFSEMLPGPEDLRLAGGRTFELRVLLARAERGAGVSG